MKEKGEKWLNFGWFFFFFDCLAIRFVDGLDAGHERKGIRGDFLVWGLSSKQD